MSTPRRRPLFRLCQVEFKRGCAFHYSNETPRGRSSVARPPTRRLDFDEAFASRINNACKCQIGSKSPAIDYNHLILDLHRFYQEFLTPVADCEVNHYLQLHNSNGRAPKLLLDARVQRLTVAQNARKLQEQNKWVTCKECSYIGDVIIALEQPKFLNLAHIDKAFVDLCHAQGKQNTLLPSAAAVEKAAREARQQD